MARNWQILHMPMEWMNELCLCLLCHHSHSYLPSGACI
jgi:hypothetical protein